MNKYLNIAVRWNNCTVLPHEYLVDAHGIYQVSCSYDRMNATVSFLSNADLKETVPLYFLMGHTEDCTRFGVASFGLVKCGDSYLLIRRGKNVKVWPNRLAIPGGFVERGESTIDCLRREILEETNFCLSDDSSCKLLGVVCSPNGKSQTIMFLYEVEEYSQTANFDRIKAQEGEVEEVLVYSKEELVKELENPSTDSFAPNTRAILRRMFGVE